MGMSLGGRRLRRLERTLGIVFSLLLVFQASPLALGLGPASPSPASPVAPSGLASVASPTDPLAPIRDLIAPSRPPLPLPRPQLPSLPVPGGPGFAPGRAAPLGLPSLGRGSAAPGARPAPAGWPGGGPSLRQPGPFLAGPRLTLLAEQLVAATEPSEDASISSNPTAAPAQVLCVQPGSPATGAPCTNPTAYNAIQDAVNAANPGDEIRVANGTYQVGSGATVVNLPVSVALRGGYAGGTGGWATQGGPTNTVIDGQGARSGIVVGAGVSATIQNLEVANGALQNGGTVAVDTGALDLQNAMASGGTFSLASGTTLAFVGGTQGFGGGASWTGAGTLVLSNGTLAIGTSASDPVTGSSFELDGGTATTNGRLTVTNKLTWT